MDTVLIGIIIAILIYVFFGKYIYGYLSGGKYETYLKKYSFNKGEVVSANLTSNKDDTPAKYRFAYGFWVAVTNPQKITGEEEIFIREGGDLTKMSVSLDENGRTVVVRIPFQTGTDEDSDMVELRVNDLPLQRWNHVMITVDNQNLDIFLNGKLAASKIQGGLNTVKDSAPVDILPSFRERDFPGYLTKLTYFNFVPCLAEIHGIYNLGPTGYTFLDRLDLMALFQNGIIPGVEIEIRFPGSDENQPSTSWFSSLFGGLKETAKASLEDIGEFTKSATKALEEDSDIAAQVVEEEPEILGGEKDTEGKKNEDQKEEFTNFGITGSAQNASTIEEAFSQRSMIEGFKKKKNKDSGFGQSIVDFAKQSLRYGCIGSHVVINQIDNLV